MTSAIYVVTPCKNAFSTIDNTILSVVSQSGDFEIYFHVQDGGSNDGTLQRLESWERRLARGDFPEWGHSVRFSYASAPDKGKYDALVKGFRALDASDHAWMTWVDADETAPPGAFALASALGRRFSPTQMSWFGAAVCVTQSDLDALSLDTPFPREALKRGLCDGRHWDRLVQDGVFFRKWLWRSADPAATIADLRWAGDWSLWRSMAEAASFVQIPYPIGGCRIRTVRAMPARRDRYMAEIATILPDAARRAAFATLGAAPLARRSIQTARGGAYRIVEEPVEAFARRRYRVVCGEEPAWPDRPAALEKVAESAASTRARPGATQGDRPDIAPSVRTAPHFVAFDAQWQFPAVTEQHAFQRVSAAVRSTERGALYVAYPWATLIDKLQHNSADAGAHLAQFEQFCARLPAAGRKITVCQHILARRHANLFEQAGVSDVFWSHATREDAAAAARGGPPVRLWPFPLYPVQVPEALPEAGPEADARPRPYLFSFVGARANQYYLAETRNWILDLLRDDPRGLVLGRDSWHYQKVVYDLQVLGGTSESQSTLVDTSASAQFRDSLVDSVFSLCPSGTGPNSIRLWESIGAGTIPVVLSDSYAPPGDPRLWEMAAVFCPETREAVAALPDRLASIAASPERLAEMRHTLRQLWLLYGPQSFVVDVQQLMLAQRDAADDERASPLETLGRLLSCSAPELLLTTCASALLLEPGECLGRLDADAALARGVAEAQAAIEPDSALAAHFAAVLAHARETAAPILAPAPLRGRAPKICLFGRHANRTPLAYAPLRGPIEDRLAFVEDPAEADLVVSGFDTDLREGAEALRPALERAKPTPIAVISEEPLWDVTWSGPREGRAGGVTAKGGVIPYAFLGHETSEIFAFERIPYFLLTSDIYTIRYADLMAAYAAIEPAEMLARWRSASIGAAFFAEHRKGERYALASPDRDIFGLSVYRTEVAERVEAPGTLRAGKGWGEAVLRQQLPDWHLDKLARLAGRTRVLSAYENVHQRVYISEKIFDAFAIGAIPTYWASASHRIAELVPAGAMLNTFGLDASAAAERIAALVPDAALAEAWLSACASLCALFGDLDLIRNERRRVARALLSEILSLV